MFVAEPASRSAVSLMRIVSSVRHCHVPLPEVLQRRRELVAITFFNVCGGPFGSETAVRRRYATRVEFL